ncbi:TlpA family protein disulfide reductase [Aestuariibaculum suncheonense]|uniref:TlpA family protein disulfide reductase n=1 Tax=Aestuariibaculum suncheonense TaxID=1028745 RepID=A0A8J6QG49_9FLAO|nr:TlpA disulfide reductase family protein [Aestuariibaculum suncheonense]MBD0836030.1 TlpA family protein disulfide reductase [Aestuariibaculum suncheonense]
MKLRKIIFVLVICGITWSCAVKQLDNKTSYSFITGVFDMPYEDELTLWKVAHGKTFPVGTSVVNKDNAFGFAVNPEDEGFYILGTKNLNIPIYLNGNQNIEIVYVDDKYEMTQIPDDENEILYNWVKSIDTLKSFDFRNRKSKPTTYIEFFPFYENFITEMKKQHGLVDSNNDKFNQLMHLYIDSSIEREAIQFLFTPRVAHPDPNKLPDFYSGFKTSDIYNTTDILDVPNGMDALNLNQMLKFFYGKKGVDANKVRNLMFDDVKNDTLRGYLALKFINQFKSYNEDYLNYIEPLRASIALSDFVKNEVETYELSIKNTSTGTQGYPFTYKDQNGKDVSFKDFRGKYVYIDVWATWCSPCKKQIPYLKELERELHGKNIQFVSISLDKQKDHGKWLDFVNDEALTGVQLISEDAFNTAIAKDYKINAIPRFLLFDPEGKIIDADAKRPSDPELKQQLLQLLK